MDILPNYLWVAGGILPVLFIVLPTLGFLLAAPLARLLKFAYLRSGARPYLLEADVKLKPLEKVLVAAVLDKFLFASILAAFTITAGAAMTWTIGRGIEQIRAENAARASAGAEETAFFKGTAVDRLIALYRRLDGFLSTPDFAQKRKDDPDYVTAMIAAQREMMEDHAQLDRELAQMRRVVPTDSERVSAFLRTLRVVDMHLRTFHHKIPEQVRQSVENNIAMMDGHRERISLHPRPSSVSATFALVMGGVATLLLLAIWWRCRLSAPARLPAGDAMTEGEKPVNA